MYSSKSDLFESCENFSCEEEGFNIVAYNIKRKYGCGWIGFFDDVKVKEIFEWNRSKKRNKRISFK